MTKHTNRPRGGLSPSRGPGAASSAQTQVYSRDAQLSRPLCSSLSLAADLTAAAIEQQRRRRSAAFSKERRRSRPAETGSAPDPRRLLHCPAEQKPHDQDETARARSTQHCAAGDSWLLDWREGRSPGLVDVGRYVRLLN
jgi:hypothetical protein